MDEIEFLVAVPARGSQTSAESERGAAANVSGQKGLFRGARSGSPDDVDEEAVESRAISTRVLKENLTRVSQSVMQVLNDIRQVGDFKLKEVQLQVEVTAEGGVQFIGTSKVGGKGAITLTFSE